MSKVAKIQTAVAAYTSAVTLTKQHQPEFPTVEEMSSELKLALNHFVDTVLAFDSVYPSEEEGRAAAQALLNGKINGEDFSSRDPDFSVNCLEQIPEYLLAIFFMRVALQNGMPINGLVCPKWSEFVARHKNILI